MIKFVLNRPRSSQNIGSAARALANTCAGALWVVEPLGVGRALADCVDVIMTTGREVPDALSPEAAAARLLSAPGATALVFGDEVRGLTNRELRLAGAVATIPTAQKSSLNLAQAVMVFGYELLKARGGRPAPPAPEGAAADDKMLGLLRERARA